MQLITDGRELDMSTVYKDGMISVIIPVFNTIKYVEKCVKSIINQSYTNLEIILVDDGSTDGSGQVCDKLAKSDKRIKVIHQQNKGVSSARNNGLKNCNGEFVSFIDSDDWLELDTYVKVIDAMKDTSSDMGVFDANTVVIDNDGNVHTTPRKPWKLKDERMLISGKDLYYELGVNLTVSNKIICRKCIKKGFNESLTYGEDVIFCLEALRNTEQAVIVPYHGYNYYVNRKGNVISAEVGERDIEHLKNAYIMYCMLKEADAEEVGVLRIITAITDVIKRIPLDKMNEYKNHILQCKELAKKPSIIAIIRCFRRYKLSLRYALIWINPAIMYKIKLRK